MTDPHVLLRRGVELLMAGPFWLAGRGQMAAQGPVAMRDDVPPVSRRRRSPSSSDQCRAAKPIRRSA